MSVRDALMGLLTLGPAYGHQLLFELHTRLPHRETVNPGQVYATLNRLVAGGMILGAGATEANLPLYKLSSEGTKSSNAWLRGDTAIDVSDWSEVLDVVLLTFTLPQRSVHETCQSIMRQVEEWIAVDTASSDSLRALVAVGRRQHAEALTLWLNEVTQHASSPMHVTWGFNDARPGRGRRPNLVKELP